MKRILYIALGFCFVLADAGMSSAQQRSLSVDHDKAEVRKFLIDAAQAAADFTRTRDIEATLRFYSPEYTEIEDAKETTLLDMRQILKEILEELNLGRPYKYSVQINNISVDLNGSVPWATSDSTVISMLRGETLKTVDKKCTSIFKRSGASWLIVHEHCSTLKERRPTSPRLDNN
jgi:ketosteroid isomerase-like protein